MVQFFEKILIIHKMIQNQQSPFPRLTSNLPGQIGYYIHYDPRIPVRCPVECPMCVGPKVSQKPNWAHWGSHESAEAIGGRTDTARSRISVVGRSYVICERQRRPLGIGRAYVIRFCERLRRPLGIAPIPLEVESVSSGVRMPSERGCGGHQWICL